jgi:hypothetical protein
MKILANYLRIRRYGPTISPDDSLNNYLIVVGNYLDGDDLPLDTLKDYLAKHGKTTKELTADDFGNLFNISLDKMKEHLVELRSEYEKQ